MVKERKIKFDLIPDGCWKYNLRNILPKKLWSFLRQDSYDRANGKCFICGKKLKKFEAHEVWDYDSDNGVIILKDVICLCPLCHKTIHIGRTSLTDDYIKAQDNYIKLNDISYSEMIKDLGEANLLQKQRSLVSEWKMDIGWLKRFVNDEQQEENLK